MNGPSSSESCRENLAISVVIPTFQRDDFLRECLVQLAPGAQSLGFMLYEVIVTDDGKASTAERMVREEFPWARWTAGPQHGPAANRNHGAKQARGEWLAFTDDDCVPSPGWLQAFYEGISHDVQILEGCTTCVGGLPSLMYESPANENGGYLWSCNFAISTSTFFHMDGFDESFPAPAMEDVDLRERIYNAGLEFKFVSDAVVDHPARLTVSARSKADHFRSIVYFYKKHNRALPSRGRFIRDYLKDILRQLVRSRNRRGASRFVLRRLAVLYLVLQKYPSNLE